MKQELLVKAMFVILIAFGFGWAASYKPMRLGLDLQGGVKLMAKVDFDEGEAEKKRRDPEFKGWSTGEKVNLMGDIQAVLERRLNDTGLAEVSIRQRGRDKFQIEVPGANEADADRLRRLIESPGTLEFLIVAEGDPITGRAFDQRKFDQFVDVTDRNDLPIDDPEWSEILFMEVKEPYGVSMRNVGVTPQKFVPLLNPEYMKQKYKLTGEDLVHVGQGTDSDGSPAANFRFNAEKRALFKDLTEEFGPTSKNADDGHQLAIVVDGRIHSAPQIDGVIPGEGIIRGYSGEDLHNLIITMRNGSLVVPLKVASESTVGPSLGKVQIEQSWHAILFGFSLVVLMILMYYRFSGFVANMALILNLVIIMGTMKLFNATLTLPGIAGILLTVGMSVDANILIFERIREEQAKGKSLRQSIMNGYSRAFVTIFDANMTTLITAFILYHFGVGPIRGFAVTLTIGILASMFTALFCTRIVFDWLIATKRMTRLNMASLFSNPSIDFLGKKGIALVFSLVLILVGLTTMIMVGKDMLGIDFKGGSSIHIVFAEPQQTEELREALSGLRGEEDPSAPRYRGLRVITTFDPEHRKLNLSAGQAYEFEISTTNTNLPRLEDDIRQLFGDRLVTDTFSHDVLRMDDTVVLKQDLDRNLPNNIKLRFNIAFPEAVAGASIEKVLKRMDDRFRTATVEDKGMVGKLYTLEVTTPEIDLSVAQSGRTESIYSNYLLTVSAFHDALLDADYKFISPIPSKEAIGAEVSSELFSSAATSMIFAILAIILYVTFRFNREWKYGIAAVAALLHDVCVVVGAMAVAVAISDTGFGRMLGLGEIEVNLPIVGVLLAIIGYSLNDTIVIFDRIRENMRGAGKRADKPALINASINQTLSRTLLTSMTTFITVLTLFLIGGKVIKSISFALCVGIIVGTYSTVFIASPLLTMWYPKAPSDEPTGEAAAKKEKTLAAAVK